MLLSSRDGTFMYSMAPTKQKIFLLEATAGEKRIDLERLPTQEFHFPVLKLCDVICLLFCLSCFVLFVISLYFLV